MDTNKHESKKTFTLISQINANFFFESVIIRAIRVKIFVFIRVHSRLRNNFYFVRLNLPVNRWFITSVVM